MDGSATWRLHDAYKTEIVELIVERIEAAQDPSVFEALSGQSQWSADVAGQSQARPTGSQCLRMPESWMRGTRASVVTPSIRLCGRERISRSVQRADPCIFDSPGSTSERNLNAVDRALALKLDSILLANGCTIAAQLFVFLQELSKCEGSLTLPAAGTVHFRLEKLIGGFFLARERVLLRRSGELSDILDAHDFFLSFSLFSIRSSFQTKRKYNLQDRKQELSCVRECTLKYALALPEGESGDPGSRRSGTR